MQSPDTERIKHDARDYAVMCLQCDQPFEAKRSDATFCSANCRVAYSREPKKLENALLGLQSDIIRFRTLAYKYRRNQRVFEQFVLLQKELNGIIAIFEEV